MTWFKVDDGFPEHPKLEELEREPRLYMAAVTVWMVMGCDCSRRLTDGYVSASRLEKVLGKLGKSALDGANALVRCGLWDSSDGGWRFHDWAEYQPKKADVVAARRKKAERQNRWRTKNVDASRDAPVDGAVDASQDANVDAVVDAPVDASRDAPVDGAHARVSRPDPTRPDQFQRARTQTFTAERQAVVFRAEYERAMGTAPGMAGKHVGGFHGAVIRTAELQTRDPEEIFREALAAWLRRPHGDPERRAPYACFCQAWGDLTGRKGPPPVQPPPGFNPLALP